MSIEELLCKHCGPGYRFGDEGCKHIPPNEVVRVLLQEKEALQRIMEARAKTYRLALDQLGREMAEALGRDPEQFPLTYGTDVMIQQIRDLVANQRTPA